MTKLVIIILVLVLATNIIIAHFIGKMGKEKTIGYVKSFWLSFFFTPLIAILIVIASRPIPKSEEKQIGIGKIIGQFSFGIICICILFGISIGIMVVHTNTELKESETKLKELETKSQQGNAQAQYELGKFYHFGTPGVVKKNDTTTFYWYQKAAAQGHKDAQYELGNCYLIGKGVKKDYKKADYWWEKAAAQGHKGAQDYLD